MRAYPVALTCFLLPLAAATSAAPQAQEEGRSIPYRALYAPLTAVKQADPVGIVTSSVCAESVQPGASLPPDLRIELHTGTTRQPLALDPHACIALPLRADWASGDAAIWISQPKDAVKLVETFRMRAPTTTRISYGQLMESLPVLERIRQQQVPIASLTGTAPQGVELAYEPGIPQTVVIGSGAQAKSWTTDAAGHVRLPFDPALPASIPVVLSAVPAALQPYPP